MNREILNAKLTELFRRSALPSDLDEAILLVKQGADVNLRFPRELTLLHFATQSNLTEHADKLIKLGANLYAKDMAKSVALDKSLENGFVDMVKVFIDNGFDVNHSEGQLLKPLSRALNSHSSNFEMVKLLIDSGADINDVNGYNVTPLHIASSKGFVQAMQELIDRGADVNQQDMGGATALHDACDGMLLEPIELLVNSGADISLLDNDGKSALDITIETKFNRQRKDVIIDYVKQKFVEAEQRDSQEREFPLKEAFGLKR